MGIATLLLGAQPFNPMASIAGATMNQKGTFLE
jgi:hypothetical protein